MRSLINPAAMAVRLPVAESLRLISAHLIKQLAARVGVVIGRGLLDAAAINTARSMSASEKCSLPFGLKAALSGPEPHCN